MPDVIEGDLTLLHCGVQSYAETVRDARKRGVDDILVYCIREEDVHPYVHSNARVVEVGLGEPMF